MIRVFDAPTWRKIGQPDLGSKMYYILNGKKIWGVVTSIDYGHKKGVKLKIKPFK
jgi:hypothetical protein